jgi:phosphonoacetate hydrolase
MKLLEPVKGIEAVYDRHGVCKAFDLPLDREGDVAVISERGVCVGGAEKEHDLSGLEGHRLRTHGGVTEARVPFVISEPVTEAYRQRARTKALNSHQIFDFALNGIAH